MRPCSQPCPPATAGPLDALRALQAPGVATGLAARHDLDLLALLDDVHRLTGCEAVDVLDLRRAGPLARCEAPERGAPLHEGAPGLLAAAHTAAVAHDADTA